VSERDPKVFEVLIGQLRQDVSVDFAFAEGGLVLAEPEAP